MKRWLLRWFSKASPPTAGAWLDRADPEEAAGEALARALHGHAAPMPNLRRREVAAFHAARRRKWRELAEAIEGLPYPAALRLAEALGARADLDREGLVASARRILSRTPEGEMALAALALLALSPSPDDLPLLLRAATKAPGAPAAARVVAALPEETARPALRELIGRAAGIGRTLAIEEFLRGRAPGDEAPFLLGATAEVEDPLARAWGSVPLLETEEVAALAEEAAHHEALILCLEANARGGWRGGPGPGLGRLPGSLRVAERLLDLASDERRERIARALLEAHPAPPETLRQKAREISGG